MRLWLTTPNLLLSEDSLVKARQVGVGIRLAAVVNVMNRRTENSDQSLLGDLNGVLKYVLKLRMSIISVVSLVQKGLLFY